MRFPYRTVSGVLMLAASAFAAGQSFQGKGIRFIIPYPPGGGGDTLGRTVAQKLSESIGIPVIVDNRGGAGGIIGTDLAAKAPPDGMTLVLGTPSPITVAPYLNKKMPYDPVRDLAPVTLITVVPAVVTVHPSLPVRSVRQLIELARARPGELTYSSSGNGGTGHLSGLMLETMGKVRMLHVPYKGTGPGLTAVLSGEVSFSVGTMLATLPLVKAGRLRAIAVTSEKRSPVIPEVPAVAETLPGYSAGPFYGVLAPGGTPPDMVNRRRNEIVKILGDPELRNRLVAEGGEVVGSTPAEFAALIKAESARWGEVIKQAKLQPE
jgi:tripartite-type tricarboxylate transporter receptor subunit TctC